MRPVSMLLTGISLVALLTMSVVGQSDHGRGGGDYRVQAFTELQTTDGTIRTLSATPTAELPGPVAFDVEDALRFNGRWTNTKHAVLVEVQSATDGSGASARTIHGTTHTIADWIHVRQDDASTFATVQQTGVFDADPERYVAPGGFSKDSQGTLTLRSYATAGPTDGGTTNLVHWIYDASGDVYWFDVVDSDFTNGNGETRVYPISHSVRTGYTFALGGLTYAVQRVADGAQNHVPTVNMAWTKVPGAANGHDFEVTVLFDFPAGTPRDQYDFVVQATIHSLK